MTWHIQLLGSFELLDGEGNTIALTARKARAMLAYLACHNAVDVPRERLANLLWSGSDARSSRNSLRQCLLTLRNAFGPLGPEVIASTATGIRLDLQFARLDVADFERLCDQATITALVQATNLYRGEFLDGPEIGEREFDEWLAIERRRLAERRMRALNRLFIDHRRASRYDSVIDVGSRLLSIDPLQEDVQRGLMTAYHAQGRLGAVTDRYTALRATLLDELGIEPATETRQLYRELMSQDATGRILPTRFADADREEHTSASADATTMVMREPTTRAPATRALMTRKSSLLIGSLFMASALVIIASPGREEDATLDARVGRSPDGHDAVTVNESRPSIAVLPFLNLDDAPGQSYFSDGLTEDLITDLSRLSGLTVIASSSSFAYRDATLDPGEIARELGVGHVLQGSVRRVGSREDRRVRVNARLIDARSGTLLWAERFDEALADIFTLQDEVTRTIVAQLAVTLTSSEERLFDEVQRVDPDAYDLLLRGLQPLQQFTREGLVAARSYFTRAIAHDPDYARAHANIALTYGTSVVFRLTNDRQAAIELGQRAVARAMALDDRLPQTQFALGVLSLASGAHDDAIRASRRAIELEPNYADGYALLAQTAGYGGRVEEALKAIGTAKRLSPKIPFSYLWVEGHLLYLLGRDVQARATLEKVIARNPTFVPGLVLLAATCGQLGLLDEAAWHIEELLVLEPSFSARVEARDAPYLHEKDRERLLDGLSKAGLSG